MEQTNKTSISEPNFTKSEGKVRFGHILKDYKRSSRRAEQDANKQKALSFQKVGKKRKMVIKLPGRGLDSRRQGLRGDWVRQRASEMSDERQKE